MEQRMLPLKQEGEPLFPLYPPPGAPQLLRTAACWVSLGTQGTVTVMLLKVPCSDAKRMGPTLCAQAQDLTAPSPSPWQCFSTAGSSTFPSAGWMVGAAMPWAGRAGTTRSIFSLWLPWSSTTCSSPCSWWTDTVAADNTPVCSSPSSPDTPVDVHAHFQPHQLLLAQSTLGCIPLASPKSPSLQSHTIPWPTPCSPR